MTKPRMRSPSVSAMPRLVAKPVSLMRRAYSAVGGVILHIALRQAPDRGGAKADQGVGGVGRIALEVARERIRAPADRRARRSGRGRRGHSRRATSMRARRLACAKRSIGPGSASVSISAWCFRRDGKVRVAEGGNAARLQLEHLADRVLDAVAGLMRQAVDEVDVDRVDAVTAERQRPPAASPRTTGGG